jgi:hypothetical protein
LPHLKELILRASVVKRCGNTQDTTRKPSTYALLTEWAPGSDLSPIKGCRGFHGFKFAYSDLFHRVYLLSLQIKGSFLSGMPDRKKYAQKISALIT